MTTPTRRPCRRRGPSRWDGVTEEALAALYAGRDPVTLETLGRAAPTYPVVDGRRPRHAVAGFDLTFTVPKSVSVMWAMVDEPTRALITHAHHLAVNDALAFLEERVAGTRVGHDGAQSVAVRGLVAAAFYHWDTRAGDPNLHTHLVIANKVQGVDGAWRSLDGRRLHKAAVAVSELYDDLLADRPAAALPVGWSRRHRGRSRTPAFEVDGVDDGLLAEFSQRSTQVTARTRDLAAAFRIEHGRCPSRVERTRLAQRACPDTRPARSPHARWPLCWPTGGNAPMPPPAGYRRTWLQRPWPERLSGRCWPVTSGRR